MTRYRYGLAGYAPGLSEATVDVESLDSGRRLRRALGAAAGWLGATVVCVFIPIAHFVLVPLGLVMTVVMGLRGLGQKAMVVAARGRCPDCGTEQDLDLLGPWRGTRDLTCRSCQRPMRFVEGGEGRLREATESDGG